MTIVTNGTVATSDEGRPIRRPDSIMRGGALQSLACAGTLHQDRVCTSCALVQMPDGV